MKSLEQRRAASALRAVKGFGAQPEIRRFLEGMPAALMVNGAMTVMIKCWNDHREIHDAMSGWLRQQFTLRAELVEQQMVDMEAAVYRQVTLESMRYAEWLKRWAQALIPKEAASVEQTAQPAATENAERRGRGATEANTANRGADSGPGRPLRPGQPART